MNCNALCSMGEEFVPALLNLGRACAWVYSAVMEIAWMIQPDDTSHQNCVKGLKTRSDKSGRKQAADSPSSETASAPFNLWGIFPAAS